MTNLQTGVILLVLSLILYVIHNTTLTLINSLIGLFASGYIMATSNLARD